MRSEDLVSSFGEIARAKDIDRDTLQIIIEDVIRAMINKRYGSDEAFEIIFNPSQGDIQILHIQEVVDEWELVDPVTEIELSKALHIDEDAELGDEVASEMNISDFGRRAVMTARQTFRQRIRDLEKEQIYNEYSEIIGEIVVGEVYQVRRHETLIMHEGTELVLPRSEQIPSDHYRKGTMVRTVVKEVRRDAGSDPQVVVSRASPVFMERLFEVEVPEVYDGIVEIKKIARIPGDRAKVAVTSHDERVDPVGACVGVKGVRIHAVVRELSNENIDVMQWTDDPQKLIARALSPANPTKVTLTETGETKRARAEVPGDEVSQAIGKRGVNIKLASKLTGYEIDVYREIPADEEDIDIEEFGDEIEAETIQKLKRIGCDTGKAVLELSSDALARRADLPRETAQEVIDIIETEFEKGPGVAESLQRGDFVIESLGDDVADVEVSDEDDLADAGTDAEEADAEEADAEEADAEPEDVDMEVEDVSDAEEGDDDTSVADEPVAGDSSSEVEPEEATISATEGEDANEMETSADESVEGDASDDSPDIDDATQTPDASTEAAPDVASSTDDAPTPESETVPNTPEANE